jgi:hypothetical protein
MDAAIPDPLAAQATPATLGPVAPIGPDSLDFEARKRLMAVAAERSTMFVLTGSSRGGSGFGTGFVVAEGLLLTDGCLTGKPGGIKPLAVNASMPLTETTIVASECSGDGSGLALLRFQPPAGAPIPALPFSDGGMEGDWVSAWGYQAGVLELDASWGCIRQRDVSCMVAPPVSATNGEVSMAEDGVLHHNARVDMGNRGGPLMDGSGMVVGVAMPPVSGRTDPLGQGLALGSRRAVAFLRKNGVKPLLAPGFQESGPAPSRPAAKGAPEAQAKKPAGPPEGARKGLAPGRVRDLGGFSVGIPPGWRAVEVSENAILITTDDGLTNLAIVMNNDEGLSMKEIAKAYSLATEGTEPVLDEDAGLWEFEFGDDGMPALAFVFPWTRGKHFLIYCSGDMGNDDIPGIIEDLLS